MCYNCGSTDHIAKACKKTIKKGNEYNYAKCFVCNEQGHLSGQCPKNEKGLYPNGGSCRFCNQVTHLAKDCTIRNKGKLTETIIINYMTISNFSLYIIDIGYVVSKLDLQHGADDDDFHIQVQEKTDEKVNTMKFGNSKSKRKIVKF